MTDDREQLEAAVGALLDDNIAKFDEIASGILADRTAEVVLAYREELAKSAFDFTGNGEDIEEEVEELGESHTTLEDMESEALKNSGTHNISVLGLNVHHDGKKFHYWTGSGLSTKADMKAGSISREKAKSIHNKNVGIEEETLEERDEGKPGKNFAKIADSAGKHYGSKAAGERVAGAILAKLRAKHPRKYAEEFDLEEEFSLPDDTTLDALIETKIPFYHRQKIATVTNDEKGIAELSAHKAKISEYNKSREPGQPRIALDIRGRLGKNNPHSKEYSNNFAGHGTGSKLNFGNIKKEHATRFDVYAHHRLE